MTHHLHDLDGRRMGITGLGDPLSQRLVVLCHPAPGAGDFDPDPLVTNQWGVRIVAPDRPGYGSSEPNGTDADPLEAWLDDLDDYLRWVTGNAEENSSVDYSRIGLIGWGAGGLYAAAFASRHPELVDRLAMVQAPFESHAPVPDGVMDAAPDEPATESTAAAGLADRWASTREQAMLQGSAGLEADRLAMGAGTRPVALAGVAADTLLVFEDSEPSLRAARGYHRGLPRSRGLRVPRSAGPTIAAAWPRILAHVAPAHGMVPEQLRHPEPSGDAANR